MSFANTVLQQRERELKALRIFLACSLVGSLLFHIVLLASGIGRLLNRIPQVEEEPVEITLLDTPIEEIEPKEEIKPKPEPQKIEPEAEIKPPVPDTTKIEPDLENFNRDSQISGGSPNSLSEPIPTQPRITPEAPSIAEPLPKPKLVPFEPFKEPLSPVIPEQKPEPIPENNIPTQPQPESRTPREIPAPVEPPIEPPTQPSQASEDLRRLLAQQRDSTTAVTPPEPPIPQPKTSEDLRRLRELAQQRDSRTPREIPAPVEPPIEPPTQPSQASEDLKRLLAQQQRDSRTAREIPAPVDPPIESPQATQQDDQNLRDTLSGIRKNRDTAPSLPDSSIGESSDNAPRRKRPITGGNQVATTPSTNDTNNGNGLGKGTGDSVGDGDGRAACRQCNTNYPSWAKANGIEGNVTVSVDTDAQGNVINVDLLSGSGNSRLDNYHLSLARKWKLKPSSNGRQGVTIITRYEIQ
ncbi:TonB family protein [Plectonema cf. radiosum LEGE 06105]|uniref:TonB family protein n=1 Tax=Plectonema cf. radiosum LEGE 06105 TaxID=945769 RepID=A0A8J7F2L2_9CYAN|nr:energy transducer TonB [Plectonema radiosum]MBE9213615.1 TonB family protein [Plectonema cf. radiosum LEGE 06105]